MRLIGDIHGKTTTYMSVAYGHDTIQLGDFGIGFLSERQTKDICKFHKEGNHRFIRGNHDDPELVKKTPGWIVDGYFEFEKGMMFVGGAASVDIVARTPGFDWWYDEELSIPELNAVIEKYLLVRPSIMITHTPPHSVSMDLFGKIARWPINKTKTCDTFDAMLDSHQPDLWVFGHWHNSVKKKIGKTEFVCLNELEYLDI